MYKDTKRINTIQYDYSKRHMRTNIHTYKTIGGTQGKTLQNSTAIQNNTDL